MSYYGYGGGYGGSSYGGSSYGGSSYGGTNTYTSAQPAASNWWTTPTQAPTFGMSGFSAALPSTWWDPNTFMAGVQDAASSATKSSTYLTFFQENWIAMIILGVAVVGLILNLSLKAFVENRMDSASDQASGEATAESISFGKRMFRFFTTRNPRDETGDASGDPDPSESGTGDVAGSDESESGGGGRFNKVEWVLFVLTVFGAVMDFVCSVVLLFMPAPKVDFMEELSKQRNHEVMAPLLNEVREVNPDRVADVSPSTLQALKEDLQKRKFTAPEINVIKANLNFAGKFHGRSVIEYLVERLEPSLESSIREVKPSFKERMSRARKSDDRTSSSVSKEEQGADDREEDEEEDELSRKELKPGVKSEEEDPPLLRGLYVDIGGRCDKEDAIKQALRVAREEFGRERFGAPFMVMDMGPPEAIELTGDAEGYPTEEDDDPSDDYNGTVKLLVPARQIVDLSRVSSRGGMRTIKCNAMFPVYRWFQAANLLLAFEGQPGRFVPFPIDSVEGVVYHMLEVSPPEYKMYTELLEFGLQSQCVEKAFQTAAKFSYEILLRRGGITKIESEQVDKLLTHVILGQNNDVGEGLVLHRAAPSDLAELETSTFVYY